MNQHGLELEKNEQLKEEGKFEEAFKSTKNTFAGFTYDFLPKKTFDDSPEERKKVYQELLIDGGGFRFWLNNYNDLFFDQKANLEVRPFQV